MFWRNSTGGDGVPDQVNQPRISFSQRRHVTVRSSSSLGESDSQESNVRTVSFLSYAQIHALKRTIDHPTWRNWSLIFILIILFGPSIRDIWLPKTADDYVDAVLTIAFVFLAVDIIIRCIVDRAYFSWNVKSRGSSDMPCRVGSFMFWFDTVRVIFWTLSSALDATCVLIYSCFAFQCSSLHWCPSFTR